MKRLLATVALGAACIGGAAARAQDSPLPEETRWAILIDASDAATVKEESPKTEAAQTSAARADFCKRLSENGIPEDHIFVYSTDANDEARKPTRANILAVLDALRNVDEWVELDQGDAAQTRRWRGDDIEAPCEVQLYVIGGGVALEDGGRTRNFIAPCDASLANVAGAESERLIDVAEIENALLNPEGFPIERVFLSINFWTTEEATRGAGSGSNLSDVDLKSVGTRGSSDEDEDAEKAKGFSYVRVLTSSARFDDATADSFYKTLTDGMSGYADVARNGDGWVGALELAEYVRDNVRDASVELSFNGSTTYSIAESKRRIEPVDPELFAEIEKAMTNEANKALRESARKRKEKARKAQAEAVDAPRSSDDGTRGLSKEGGVLR